MKKIKALLTALTLALSALPAWGLTLGTFNIEYFDITGPNRYVPDELTKLARRIESSGADLIALQEIEGDATLRFFTTRFLRGWRFVGNDTAGRQDLYFLYNPAAVTLVDGPAVYFSNASFFDGERAARLFDRPPLVASFKDKASGTVFTAVNLHLKSMSTRGKTNQQAAQARNDRKRAAQIERVNALTASLKGPVFILGDYNTPSPQGLAFSLIPLPRGAHSYDAKASTLDYIGFQGLTVKGQLMAREVEMSLSSRSKGRSQHPDHDLILVDLHFVSP